MRSASLIPVGLAVLVVVLVVGCSSADTTRAVVAPNAAATVTSPTAAGHYPAGTHLVLSNGATLAVPDNWEAELLSTGALISTQPAVSGVLGGVLDVPTVPHWGTVTFSVYGPEAGFGSDLARLDQTYARSLGADPATASFSVTRSNISLAGGDATATAYVTTRPTKPPRHEFYIFVRRAGSAPIVVASQLSTLPPGFEGATVDQMPQLLLDYLDFKWQ